MEAFFKELGQHLWGEKTAAFHIIGMTLSFIGTIVCKKVYYHFDKKTAIAAGYDFPPFSFKRWLSENWFDVICSVAATFILMRCIDLIFHFIGENNIKIMGYKISNFDDQIGFYIVFAVAIQYYFHKWFKPVRNQKKKL